MTPKTVLSDVFLKDCMEGMSQYPDKYFDLAVVDPPYGINADKKNSKKELKSIKSAALSKHYGDQVWDLDIPKAEYFKELERVSSRQVIWGANYFGLVGGMLYWHKNVTMPTYSSGELAYLSWLNKIEFVSISWHGMIQGDMKNKELRIHPTQKPVKLYDWIFANYAKEGDKILDTHLGSGSSRISAYKAGLDFTGFEIDPDYFNAAEKRFNEFKAQLRLDL